MPITTTWAVNNMQRTDADGGVFLVYWSCTAKSEGSLPYTAVEAGKLRCKPEPSSPTLVSYDQLTEEHVLSWVYASLTLGEETPEEAKARVEADRISKVQAQIDSANTVLTGTPWANADLPA